MSASVALASSVRLIGGYERLFIGFFSDGGLASVANFPARFVSHIDSYQYKQAEVSYEYFLHSTRKPAPGFVHRASKRLLAKVRIPIAAQSDLLYMLWDVGGLLRRRIPEDEFLQAVDGKQETPTNDGCVKVYAVCQRSSTPSMEFCSVTRVFEARPIGERRVQASRLCRNSCFDGRFHGLGTAERRIPRPQRMKVDGKPARRKGITSRATVGGRRCRWLCSSIARCSSPPRPGLEARVNFYFP